jgi:NAD(P)-dependent dehydrogenase (short-subunit alcohol dehydrogenase family)
LCIAPADSSSSPYEFQRAEINFTAAAMIAKGFRQRGVHEPNAGIVFVSSVMGSVGAPGRSAYCASKGALQSLTRSLALELVRDGIRVNCIAPAFVRSDMLQNAESMLSTEELEWIEGQHPLGFGHPRDVSYSIAFLLGETGRWITGSILIVDGGYTA